MIEHFSGNALWQLVSQSDGLSKGVLFLLLVLSIASWTVVLYKTILFRVKKRQARELLNVINDARSVDDLHAIATSYEATLPGYVVAKYLVFFKSLPNISMHDMRGAERHLLQEQGYVIVDEVMALEQSYISVLTTSAAAAPLLGLFGTIWGLIHSFVRISQQQSADIATVAPGIAEALITTLAGLMVAIPAVILSSVVYAQLRSLEQDVTLLVEKVGAVLSRTVRVTDSSAWNLQLNKGDNDAAATLS